MSSLLSNHFMGSQAPPLTMMLTSILAFQGAYEDGSWELGSGWELLGIPWVFARRNPLQCSAGSLWGNLGAAGGRVKNMSRSSAQKEIANWYGLSLDLQH